VVENPANRINTVGDAGDLKRFEIGRGILDPFLCFKVDLERSGKGLL